MTKKPDRQTGRATPAKPKPFLKIRKDDLPKRPQSTKPPADTAHDLMPRRPADLNAAPARTPNDGLGRLITFGLACIVLLIGGVGGWAATTKISGAVLASGKLAVDSSVKPVQHPTGGVVKEIRVRNGDRVNAGDLLLRLDETVLRAQMLMSSKQIDELLIRIARLKAERDGKETVAFPAEITQRSSEKHIAEALNGELRLFKSRVFSHLKLKQQLRERIAQLEQEIAGIEGQVTAKDLEIELIDKELEGLATLEEKQLVTTNRITSMRRQAARLKGERAELAAQAAKSRGRIAEIEINIVQRDEDRSTEIVKELREAQSKLSELRERKVAANDQLKRVDIVAPQTGLIHELSVHAEGAVVKPASPILLVVPADDKLVVEARINPLQIDRVKMGAKAFLLFTALNQRTTPIIDGTVESISADLSRDEVTGEYFYKARLTIPDQQLTRLGQVALMPGMPVDVQIRTDDRTALSYLLKPFTDQAMRAFRER